MTNQAPAPNREPGGRSDWAGAKWLPLLLLPILCCALPGVLVALAAASAAALGAGIAVVVVVVLAIAAAVLFARYRRRCQAEQCLPSTTARRETQARRESSS